MADTKFLVWLDILGFDGLTKKIAKETGMEARKVREDFIETINERVTSIEYKKEIIGKNYGERDDWILVTENLDLAFKVASDILDHNTQYRHHERIPLEIAVGTGKYDRWGSLDDKGLIVEDSTVGFLKTKIIDYYHEWYKKNNPKKFLDSTFVVLTDSAYSELNKLDRMSCRKIEFKHKTSEDKEEIVSFFDIDVDVVRQRGRIFEFLEKIGRPFSKLYDRIDSLYVPPIEYGEIRRSLRFNKIVFITGTPEYGKTYTAVRLLWEYFCLGYEPLWMAGGELQERLNLRKSLEEIESQLTKYSKRIIYFEDPFGKTRYETRDVLEREIGTIIESIRKSKNTYVIITSREEIFKEFEKEQLSSVDVRRFEKTLNIRKPSYDCPKRRSLLMKWAIYRDCRWLRNSELRGFVLEEIAKPSKLPTPLSIKDFVYSTVDVEDESHLSDKIEEKSKETAKSFAKQIENMTTDKILFLLFPFAAPLSKEVVKKSYNRLVRKLHLSKSGNFTQILDWFADDKIVIVKGKIVFSHPSYREAVEDVLAGQQYATEPYKSIFGELLLDLVDLGLASDVSWSLSDVFHIIDADAKRELITKLAKLDAATKGLTSVVSSCFDEIPRDILGRFLLNLADREEAAQDVAWAIFNNFDRIPKAVRNELLTRLADKNQAAKPVASIILCNFTELPADAQTIVFALANKEDTSKDVASAVLDNFDRIPSTVRDELLTKLADKSQAAKVVAMVALYKFNKFSKKTIHGLLTKLQETEDASWILASVIARYSPKLPSKMKEILLSCADKDDSGIGVVWAIEENFENLDSDLRNSLLSKLACKCPIDISSILINCYDSLSLGTREKMLQRISQKDAEAPAFVRIVGQALKEPHQESVTLPRSLRRRVWPLLSEMIASPNALFRKNALLLTRVFRSELESWERESVLSTLSADKDEAISNEAKEMMKPMKGKGSKRSLLAHYADVFSTLDAFHDVFDEFD
jgi:hypothetical protein